MPKKETKQKETNLFEECFELPNPGLRAYFSTVVKGQPDEYRTPFYSGKTPQEVLKMWSPVLETINNDWPSLYEYEVDLGKKVGPMSIMKPLAERMSDIESYYDSISMSQAPVDERAINALEREWSQIAGLRHRSQQRTVDEMKKSTNSGSPYFTKRKVVTSKTIPCTSWQDGDFTGQYLTYSVGTVNKRPTTKFYGACAILGWRGQEGGPNPEDVKQRVVWMFPYAVNIEELQMYQPLIIACQKYDLVPAWVSLDKVDEKITQLFDTKSDDDLIICTDFTKFDQHFNAECQAVAERILEYVFKGDELIRGWLDEVFPIKYHIPLAIDWNTVLTGPHGMGSGSGGTNADETITHRVLQHEAALLNGGELNPNSQCLGDDGVLSYPGCTVEDVVRVYTSHGLEMNQDKQYASKQDCTYLRRWHHKDYRRNGVCVGVYATTRALGRLCEQERYYDSEKWSREMVALRQLSIIENVKWHPLREEFADFCMKGDRYRLGLDIPGFLENLSKKVEEAIEYMPDFLGYIKSMDREDKARDYGITDWWIVQYLRSKA